VSKTYHPVHPQGCKIAALLFSYLLTARLCDDYEILHDAQLWFWIEEAHAGMAYYR
jgi:hypothetical protein